MGERVAGDNTLLVKGYRNGTDDPDLMQGVRIDDRVNMRGLHKREIAGDGLEIYVRTC